MLTDRLSEFLFVVPAFLVSLSVHECAHAWMAYRCGDDTAKRMGRMTLNPIAHISIVGTIIVPLLAPFGWAKPVPVNYGALTRQDIFKVAAAGPSANLLLAGSLAFIFRVFGLEAVPAIGNYVLLAIFFNLILAVFNLLPIPPLDGSQIVYARLKSQQAVEAYNNFARYGMFVLIGFLVLGGISLIIPVAGFLYSLLGLPLPTLTLCGPRPGRDSPVESE